MKKNAFNRIYILLFLITLSQSVYADIHNEPDVQNFIDQMVQNHGFNINHLNTVFSKAKISTSILDAISRPAEAMPWYKYRQIFIRKDRIALGRKFIKENKKLLDAAEEKFGVPQEIIAAIIGVETRYGSNKGSYNVIDSLVTLGFRYPKRASFFRSELEQFLLLAREQDIDPNLIKGSYAGAMGIPQFISSSYRAYAIDFDNDGKIDIWDNTADAIGSVANYFKMHGWEQGKSIILKANVSGNNLEEVLGNSLEPDKTISELMDYGVSTNELIADNIHARLFKYELENGEEYWLGLKNFYVITRYNHSSLYAMAVFQLSQEMTINPDE